MAERDMSYAHIGEEIHTNIDIDQDEGVVRLTREINDKEIGPREIVSQIHLLEQNISKLRQEAEQARSDAEEKEEKANNLESILDDLDNAKDWALEASQDELEDALDDIADEVEHRVRAGYTWDSGLTREENQRQMYAQLKEYAARHKRVAGEFSPKLVNTVIREDEYLDDPFRNVRADHIKGSQE